jgi:hypothetical protein
LTTAIAVFCRPISQRYFGCSGSRVKACTSMLTQIFQRSTEMPKRAAIAAHQTL